MISYAFINGKMCAPVSFASGDNSGKLISCVDEVQAQAKLDLATSCFQIKLFTCGKCSRPAQALYFPDHNVSKCFQTRDA